MVASNCSPSSLTSKLGFLKINENTIKTLSQKCGFLSILDIAKATAGHTIAEIKDVEKAGETLLIQARLQDARSNKFLILRSADHRTLQCYVGGENKEIFDFANKTLTKESIVLVHGEVKACKVKSCAVKDFEIHVDRLYCVAQASTFVDPSTSLTFATLETKCDLTAAAGPENTATGLSKRLDARVIDLRTSASHAIFHLESRILNYMRTYCLDNGFVEMLFPKLMGGASEGGAEVFEVKYLNDKTAFLAQSPQLYKQIAICADYERVFSVGPVFRAENSNTHRHLCEFTGFDVEIAFKQHYHESMFLIDGMLRFMFSQLFSPQNEKFLSTIRECFCIEPRIEIGEKTKVFHYRDVIKIMNEELNANLGHFDDLSTTNEKDFGRYVKEKHNIDYYIIDKFPAAIRTFYTLDDTDEPGSGYSNSYDFFVRGEEIMSGAQRVNDAEMLVANIKKKNINPETLRHYIDCIASGVACHAGGGIGFERLVFLTLGLGNIRRATLFPRDPNRLFP